jgi:predicted AlkP superfamily phosphohydrolase/phosphomutase
MCTPPKVFLLGLDGATWKVLDRLIREGYMPALGALVKEGTSGILRSTIPYITPVAWSSLLSGVKPLKHGIFSYDVMENRDGIILSHLANRTMIKAPTVYDIYSQVGKRVISLNMPMSYPPRPEDGVIVSGFMTPSWDSRFYFPEGLMDELGAHGIDYRIDIKFAREQQAEIDDRVTAYLADGAAEFLRDLRHVTEEREKAVHYLLSGTEWDLFMVTFISMDRIQHFLWKVFENGDCDPKLRRKVFEHYRFIDSIVGRIYSAVKDKALIVVCSDHGFGDFKGGFYLNVWLEEMGYCVSAGGGLTATGLAKKVLGRLGIKKTLRRLLEKSDQAVAKRLIFMGSSNIDWGRTRAYVYSADGIRINLKGRDQYGIVEPGQEFDRIRQEIKQALLGIKTDGGEQLLKKVHFVEDLYGGPAAEETPDIIYEFADECHYSTYYRKGKSHKILDRSYPWKQGGHRRDGMVLIAGKGVVPGRRVTADIEDILPTVLYIQGLPDSEDFDGRVISEAFDEEFASERRGRQRRRYVRAAPEASKGEKDDEVMDRLKGLGYI